MLENKVIYIIDNTPVDEDLINYFENFNIRLIQQANLFPLPLGGEALLIKASIIENYPEKVYEIYNTYTAPIIIIHDTPNEELCISFLEQGADDFMIKPLFPKEVHARIQAIKRRMIDRTSIAPRTNKETINFASWRICSASRQLFNRNNQEVKLSSGEYELLIILAQQPQKVLNREFLAIATKNKPFNPLDRKIDIQISRLRHKIEADAKKPCFIKTVRNGGYLFTPEVTKEASW